MHTYKKTTFCELTAKSIGTKRYLFVSDVHLGHSRTHTWYITDTLNRQIFNVETMLDLDAIFIPGDLFDKLLNLPASEMDDINDWIERMLRLSKSTNTPIRILEGTPSHDWKQSKLITKLNEIYQIHADVQHYDELSIIDDKVLGITVGYVPDEWRESCDQTTVEFKELLATRGYSSVDMIVMHGMFEFQIPLAAAKSVSHFKEDVWEQWANWAIVIGHDHRHKRKGKITVPGSWERLAHNEEDPKGCLVVDVSNGIVDIYHVLNELAMKYITIDGVKKTDVEVITLAEKVLKTFGDLERPIGRLKVKYNRMYDISSRLSEWKNAYSEVVVEGSSESDDVKIEADLGGDFKLAGGAINITPDNIEGIILRESEVDDDDLESFKREIELVMNTM